MLFLFPLSLLVVLGNSVYEKSIHPRTFKYQVEQIEAALKNSTLTNVSDDGVVGELIILLDKLGGTNVPMNALAELQDKQTKYSGALVLSERYGRLGMWSEVEVLAKLVSSPSLEEEPSAHSGPTYAEYLLVQKINILTHALFGAAKFNIKPPQSFVENYKNDLQKASDIYFGPDPILDLNYKSLGYALAKFSEEDLIDDILKEPKLVEIELNKGVYLGVNRCKFKTGVMKWRTEVHGWNTTAEISACKRFKPKNLDKLLEANHYMEMGAPIQTVISASKIDVTNFSYSKIAMELRSWLGLRRDSLDSPIGFISKNIFERINENARNVGVSARTLNVLDRQNANKPKISEFISEVCKIKDDYPSHKIGIYPEPQSGFHVLYPILLAIKKSLNIKIETHNKSTLIALENCFDPLFELIVNKPYLFSKSSRSSGVNIYYEAIELLEVINNGNHNSEIFLNKLAINMRESNENSYVRADGLLQIAETAHLRDQLIGEILDIFKKPERGFDYSSISAALVDLASNGNEDVFENSVNIAETFIGLNEQEAESSALYLMVAKVLAKQGRIERARTLTRKMSSRKDVLYTFREILQNFLQRS